MFQIKFPIQKDQRYYDIHYKYVLEIFKYLKCNIELKEGMDVDKTCFLCEINGQTFAFDFADSNEVNPIHTKYKTFKFHLLHGDATDNLLPFPPVSFYNWDQYYQLEKEIQYSPENLIISNRQVIYGNAIKRRTEVRSRLQAILPVERLKVDIIDQEAFWREINELGLFVHIGGHHSCMQDRASAQYMAFGCCILATTIPEIMPWYKPFNGTYLRMADDYSDLEEIIRHIQEMNYSKGLRNITAMAAKEFFKETCTPEAIGNWIQVCLVN